MEMHHKEPNKLMAIAIVIILALWCTECSAEPARPPGIPKKAFWLGGPDGGAFILLKRLDSPESTSYTGSVYYPDGSIWYEGQFVLEPVGSGPIDPTDRRQFAGWDGTQVLLQDGRALVAKKGKRPRRSSHSENEESNERK